MATELDHNGHLESMDWVDEDDEGLSAAGGEIDDAAQAAYAHIMPSVVLYDPILLSTDRLFTHRTLASTSHAHADWLHALYRNVSSCYNMVYYGSIRLLLLPMPLHATAHRHTAT